ncbi:hypothetical protein SAMN05444359_11291 [Neolewinella agarilytica]|uniref:Uncharacterized protein n=1 Tax=Neolewinella agarilytica TaxID=478744 RepID=A0A1H9HBB4_9BACT|nr:hypothetical protein SAMN05444359_11291 [Neolewinella agarilytica]
MKSINFCEAYFKCNSLLLSLQLRSSVPYPCAVAYKTTQPQDYITPPSCEAACSIPARQPTRLPNHKTTLLPPAAKQRTPPLTAAPTLLPTTILHYFPPAAKQRALSPRGSFSNTYPRAAAYKTTQLQDYRRLLSTTPII